MENSQKKAIRSTKAQIMFLCQYMAEHPEFASGDYRTPLSSDHNNTQWAKLKEALDELGPCRSLDQWKICWRDQKRKARDEGEALNKAISATRNDRPIPMLSENSVLVLSAIGQMEVECGPEESPIGFSETTRVPVCDPAQATTSSITSGIPNKRTQACAKPVFKRRARRTLPHSNFLNAQLELNNLIKDLIKEVRRSNELKEEHLNFIQESYNDQHSTECDKPHQPTSAPTSQVPPIKEESNIKLQYFKEKYMNAKLERKYLINKNKMEINKYKTEMEILKLKLMKLKSSKNGRLG